MIMMVCPNCFEEFERRGNGRGKKPICQTCKDEALARKYADAKAKRKQVKDEGKAAFSSIANRVGEGLNQDMLGACNNSVTPDIWYADEPTPNAQETRYKEIEALVAIQTCASCPIQKACLNYAMTDGDAYKYGIWGGTFAFERQGKVYDTRKSTAHTYQRKLRKRFAKLGYECPPIPTLEAANTARNATIKRREKVRELIEHGRNSREIADTLNVSLSTVWNDISLLQSASGQQ